MASSCSTRLYPSGLRSAMVDILGHRRLITTGNSVLEAGPQRVRALAEIIGPGGEDLMQLDAIAFKGQPGAGHVQPPDSRRRQVNFGDAFVPVFFEVLAPASQGTSVVHPQVLLMLHLEAGVLHRAHDVAGAGELPVREDVLADEAALAQPGVAVVRSGDAVVEQLATGTQPGPQEAKVGRVVVDANVLDQPDGAHGVEPGLSNVAVVEVTDLDQMIEPLSGVAFPGPAGLFGRQGDTQH